jgi:hypothetical protein
MNGRSLIAGGWVAACATLGCGDKGQVEPHTPVAAASATASATASAFPVESAHSKPRLLVVIVVDQLASWTLDRYLPHLSPEGAFRYGIERGVYIERAEYEYASTFTAPGHAAIYTGQPPAVTGVVANRVYDAKRGHVAFVDDGVHRVHGSDKRTASPKALRVPTAGDQLHAATGGRAKVVSLSVKDRAAILPGGQKADMAVWYEYRQKSFTSSTFYSPTLPAWLAEQNAKHPIDALLTPWEAGDPELYQKLLGRDDAPGESDWWGWGNAFPHDPKKAKRPFYVLRGAPALTERLLELSFEAATRYQLGEDEVIDLLAISVSGVDYAGHYYGPLSWEYLDHLIRADRALGRLLDRLRERGPLSVLLTADHGIMPLPERNALGGGRLFPETLLKAANEAARAALGGGAPAEPVKTLQKPFLHLADGLSAVQRAKVLGAVRDRLKTIEGVHDLHPADEARGWRTSDDSYKRAIGLSVPDGIVGDAYLVLKNGWLIDGDEPRGFGTTHGSIWALDRGVPVVYWGPGIQPQRVKETVPQPRVAASIAAMLGVRLPNVPHEPLPQLSSGATPSASAGNRSAGAPR